MTAPSAHQPFGPQFPLSEPDNPHSLGSGAPSFFLQHSLFSEPLSPHFPYLQGALFLYQNPTTCAL